MSPEQFIIGAAAAAITLLSNSPLVDAIGAIAPETPNNGACGVTRNLKPARNECAENYIGTTDSIGFDPASPSLLGCLKDYPPWSNKSSFSTRTNTTFCEYNNFGLISYGQCFDGGPEVFSVSVEENRIYTFRISCPRTASRPKFHARYGTEVFYNPEWSDKLFRDGGRPYPNDTSPDPLRIIETSSIGDIKLKLNLAASKIKFEPQFDHYPDTPNYDSDDEDPTFFDDNDETTSAGVDGEEAEPLQDTFDAQRKYVPSTASTDLPIEELEEVCTAAMHLVKQRFEDFDQLCTAQYEALNRVFGVNDAEKVTPSVRRSE